MIKRIIVLIFLTATFPVLAQKEECDCCSSEYDQFDFWLGDWVVKDRQGKLLGTNKIEKLEGNCLVSEKWNGTNEFTGRSFNYFDPERQTWNQLWISNTGNIIKLEGRFRNNKMILTGPLQSNLKGAYKNQIVWTSKKMVPLLRNGFI